MRQHRRAMDSAAEIDSRRLALADAAATHALGARIGAALAVGEAVLLEGPLGAGKTSLARGAIAAWTGRDEDAPSPTYTLVQIYDGAKGALWHADLFRLKGADEVEEIGLLDALDEAACLIEWPDRLGDRAPRDRLDVALAFAGEGRTALLRAHGAWRERLGEL